MVDGTKNPSDILTNNLDSQNVDTLFEQLNWWHAEGRAKLHVNLHSIKPSKLKKQASKLEPGRQNSCRNTSGPFMSLNFETSSFSSKGEQQVTPESAV